MKRKFAYVYSGFITHGSSIFLKKYLIGNKYIILIFNMQYVHKYTLCPSKK